MPARLLADKVCQAPRPSLDQTVAWRPASRCDSKPTAAQPGSVRYSRVTGGNIRNNHIYLPLDFFPESNRSKRGQNRPAPADDRRITSSRDSRSQPTSMKHRANSARARCRS